MNPIFLGGGAALLTVLSWTIGTFSFAHASRIANPGSVNRVRLLYAFLVLGLMNIFISGINPIQLFSIPEASHYIWFGLSGIVGLTLGDFFAFTAYHILGSRRTSLFSSFAPGAALLAGILLVNEQLSALGIVGMLISISGILLLTASRSEQQAVKEEGRGNFWKGIVYAALGAICQGLGLVLAKKGFNSSSTEINAIHATWIRMFIATVSVYAIGAFKTPLIAEFKSISYSSERLKPVLLGTLFGPVIGVSLSLFSANLIEVSITQTILSLLPVSVTFASVFFFGEKINWKSYLAVAISIAGVIILVWRDQLQALLF
ncbi:MAG: DMT family transporter [Bacteroidetes bacterium]|nr:DMT family transporter [Bacteroidota bacterium]